MDYTIKELPEGERPREKLEDHGPGYLSEVELLSIILRTGTQGKNVKELSAEILNTYSLPQIANRSMEELKQFDGISRVKAGQLLAVAELSKRLKNEERERIESFSDVKARVQDMKFLEEEKLRVFHLNSGNGIIAEEEIDGVVDEVNFKLKEVFRSAVKNNAAAVVLAHNHPSGSSEPTDADIEATEDAVETGERLGVKVLDHVIIGETVSSMKSGSNVSF